MFHNNKNNNRSFGQLFELTSLISPLVSGAFSVGGALISSSAAKSIASAQQETQLSIAQMGADIQKRWQELELQKIQTAQAALPQPTKVSGTITAATGIEPLTASIIPSGSIPNLKSCTLFFAQDNHAAKYITKPNFKNSTG